MDERVALVTGASRGIGRASALALARAGHRVVAVARDAGAAFRGRPRARMAVNLDAPFELTRGFVPDMIEAGWGRIVMISSTAGQLGAPSMAPYCASKHGVIGLMRSVAQDVAPHGVTCNAVLPGWVRTEMAERDAEHEATRRGVSADEVWIERAAQNPAGRVVKAEEVADVVAYLSSPAAAAVNGEAITVALGSVW